MQFANSLPIHKQRPYGSIVQPSQTCSSSSVAIPQVQTASVLALGVARTHGPTRSSGGPAHAAQGSLFACCPPATSCVTGTGMGPFCQANSSHVRTRVRMIGPAASKSHRQNRGPNLSWQSLNSACRGRLGTNPARPSAIGIVNVLGVAGAC